MRIKKKPVNTILKGDIFEKRVFNLIRALLRNDDFYVNRKNSEIFQKKGYPSERRRSDIIFDITIESYLPDADEYSHLIVFECKNLNKNVSVDDIEEFESKLRQVGEHNTKGVLVSSKGFAKNTVNIAKSLKIGLIRVQSNDKLEWINYRKNKYAAKLKFSDNPNEPFISSYKNKTFNNLADLLISLGAIDLYFHKEEYIKVPFVSEEKIENIIKRLWKYDIHNNGCLDTNKLCAFIQEKYSLKFDFRNLHNEVLGQIEFDPLKISVEKNLDENRFRFTLCHEIGHLILHKKLLEKRIKKREDNDYSLSLNYQVMDMSNKRLEIQANIFASHLLIPKNPLIREVAKYFIKENIHKNYLYLDSQPVNIRLTDNLLSLLSFKFKASKDAIRIKLIDLNLLRDNYNFSFRDALDRLK